MTTQRFTDDTVCTKCRAHGAPDKCWNCGTRKPAYNGDRGQFGAYMVAVDRAISRRIPGMGHRDLGDWDYYSAYAAGTRAADAANEAIREEFGCDV